MSGWLYWALFALCALILLAGVPLAARWERRREERARERWLRMPGALR